MNEIPILTHGASSTHHDSTFPTLVSVNSIKRHVSHKSALVWAEVGLNNRYLGTELLIDTGADFNAMSATCYMKLKKRGFHCKLLPTAQRNPPTTANSQPVKVLGDCLVDVRLTSNKKKNVINRVRFVVILNLNTSCILGISTLRELGLYIKGTRMEVAGQKICSVSNGRKIELLDLVVMDGTKWGLYSDSKIPMERGFHTSVNNVNNLSSTLSETNSQEYEPDEMKVGKYLVNLETTDDPPTELTIREDHTRLLSEPKNCNNQAERKLITDKVITEMVCNSNFSLRGKVKLRKILERFRSVFSSSCFDVGSFKGDKAKLNFKNGEENPVFVPVRRIPHSLREWLSKHLNEMEEKQIITKCKGSRWNSPLFVVPKKENGWRPVSDFRQLNKQLEDVYFPIPFIADLLDTLHGKKFFSSVDLRSGFYNIELDEESTDCTAFSALGQTYKYLRLPQGIKSSPIIFQQIMTEILEDCDNCLVYMDDVLLTSVTESEALDDISQLLERFGRHGFLLNPAKCLFGLKKLNYLGYQIDEKGWTITRSKIQDLLDVKPPSSTTEVRSFTGLCNFYVNCVPNLQRLLKPLHALTGKKKFQWTEECQSAFDTAKNKLAKAATMSYPSLDKRDTFYLTTDASDSGWGGCLSQYQHDKGSEVPLSFSSGSFTNSEVNWPIKEKELFSFVKNLRLYDTYLFGKSFTWRTDNRALSYFLSENVTKSTALKSCSPKVARWIDFINEFDYSIEHHGGATDVMCGPDYLSRKSAAVIGALREGDDAAEKDFNNLWLQSGVTIADMIEEQQSDEKMRKFQNGYAPLKSKKLWEVLDNNGLMIAKKKKSNERVVIIPTSLIQEVLDYHHGPQHAGIVNMTKSISSKFFLPNITKNVREYTRRCQDCIRAKSKRKDPEEPILQSSAKHPWMAVSADLIGPFPVSYQQNQYCIVVVDNLTRWTEIRPIQTKQAQAVADAFMNIFHIRGMPLSILTDNGKEFYNYALKKMFKALGTNLQYATPYRPQTNGVTERCNQKIKKLLRLWNVYDATWDRYIGPIQFLINNEYNRILNMSAFQAIHGWTLSRMDFLKPGEVEELQVTDFDSKQWAKQHSVRMTKSLGTLYIKDVENKQRRYNKLRKSYEKNVPDIERRFPVGAHVLIQFPQAPGTSKLMSNWKGVYIVNSQVDKNVYLVSHMEGQRRKMLIHKSRMKLLHYDRERDAIKKSDGSEAVAIGDELAKEKAAKPVPVSEELKEETDEHSIVKANARDYGDKKHIDLEKLNEKEIEPTARVQSDAKKEVRDVAANRHKMTLRSRK